MAYVKEENRRRYLLFGLLGMFLCGMGDIFLSFRGERGEAAVYGMIRFSIGEVPLWFYQLSFLIGILATFGYYLGTRAVYSYALDRAGDKASKLLKLYNVGATMMSLGIFGIHSVCCMAIMALQAAVRAGLPTERIDSFFAVPMLIPFVFTTIWQTLADLLVAIAYIGLICKKILPISKGWIACGPICLYLIFGLLRTGIDYGFASSLPGKFLAGGESWGLACMFLAVLCSSI